MPKIILEYVIEEEKKSSTYGFISWERLEQLMKRSGEINIEEKVTNFIVIEGGIQYGVRRTYIAGG